MIYSHDDDYNRLILEQVRGILGENRVPLHEFYKRVDNPAVDSHILKGLEIEVYELDRQEMTPHVHLRDNNGNIEIEVSLVDWRILNVKRPQNVVADWSNFTSVRKRFSEWLATDDNADNLFICWNKSNPGNELKNQYLIDNQNGYREISSELKRFLEENEDAVVLSFLRRKLYQLLMPIFSDAKKKLEFEGLNIIDVLKKLNVFTEYGFTEKNKEAIKVAEQVLKDVKIWYSFV